MEDEHRQIWFRRESGLPDSDLGISLDQNILYTAHKINRNLH